MRSKKLFTVLLIALFFLNFNSFGQEIFDPAINIGVGKNCSDKGQVAPTFPVIHIDFEFGITKNLTIAPMFNIYSNGIFNSNGKGNYSHIQSGVKATYYFDRLLNAGSKWDFYMAGSLGITFVKSKWNNGYLGERNMNATSSPMHYDIHLGSEYHLTKKIGMFVDLSTSVNSIGIAFH